MVLEVGNKQGHIIIDDNTGKIMSVLVKGIEDKTDFRAFTSYKHKGNKHYNIRNKKAYNKSSNGEHNDS